MNSVRALYEKLYNLLCGTSPHLYPWHYQWLNAIYLHQDLKRILPTLKGRILDVGCSDQPYRSWFHSPNIEKYVGIDVYPGPHVDIEITPGEAWPLPDQSFDVVICNQVLEHVKEIDVTLSEMHRVLAPGGLILITIPFIYTAHGIPHDYRRLSLYGVKALFDEEYEIIQLKDQGGVMSTLCILALVWIRNEKLTHLLTILLLPLWILFSFVINIAAYLLDFLDRTHSTYNTVLFLGRKR